jgi:anti-sigma regulatory factor (Ser/Thr protein kinase)
MAKAFTSYRIEDRSFVAYVKREIHIETGRAHFSETKVGEIDIIVSELCSNLVKHAGGGEVLYRITEIDSGNSLFEFVSIDKGPGIQDLARMMKDGTSTAGTLGHGLGAINRLSTFAQIYSVVGWGTIVYACVNTLEPRFSRGTFPDLEIRGLCVNKPRETACGDGYRVKRTDNMIAFFLGDGLGHGEQAKAAVDTAALFFSESKSASPSDIIKEMHEGVRRTRGLVSAVAVLDRKDRVWRICGVGNITVRMYNGIMYRNYMPHNGTIGLNIPNSLKDSVFPAEKNQHLVMYSDGIRSRWDLNQFPAIFKYDNTILASAIYRDFSRGTDDSSVLVAKVC